MPGKQPDPPIFYERLFRYFCKDELYLELQGDLDEEFYELCETEGYRYARKIYRREVLKMIRPSVLRKFKLQQETTFSAMFKVNTKLAFRNLIKHKLYTLINIGGLAISMAVCGLILLFVDSEMGYDRYHPDYDRVYRLALERVYPDHKSLYAITPIALSKQVAIDNPEIESVTRVFNAFGTTVQIENDQYQEQGFMGVDPNFFQTFGIKLIRGDRDEVMSLPNATVLTESAALKYFGTTDAIGKTMTSGFGELIVNGICEDVPENTHFDFNMLVPLKLLGFLTETNFVNFSVHAYMKAASGVSQETILDKVNQAVETYAAGQLERDLKISFADYKASGNRYNYFLQPLADIHLKSHLEREHEANGNITYVRIFTSVAIFIILLAAINFINLSTARSAERAKEVGIRKVLGSRKGSLINQFLIESVVVCMISMIIGVVLIYLAIPFFNDFSGKLIQPEIHQQPLTMLALLGISIVLGGIAGVYPAFILSSFKPVVVLKGKMIRSKSGSWIRNGLVVFQFFVSVALICCTLIVGQQMNFMQNLGLGYDKENVLIVEQIFNLSDVETFRNRISELPQITSAAAANNMPGIDPPFGMSFQLRGNDEEAVFNCAVFQNGFLETLKMELIAGRSYSDEFEDSLSIIINESAARVLGIYDDPIGKIVTNLAGGNNPSGNCDYRVIGMVKDYNYKSLHTEITPLGIFGDESAFGAFINSMAIRFNGSPKSAMNAVEEIWKEQSEGRPFIYHFFDDRLNQLYTAEAKSGELFLIFTAIAILIACIGLFGLATFIISSRIKEIGVRKVLGASSLRVVLLIVRDFNKLILVALVISIPIVVLLMQNWLNDFAYHISLGQTWVSFVIGGLTALAVGWITVSYHSIKAAVANPVKNLRTE